MSHFQQIDSRMVPVLGVGSPQHTRQVYHTFHRQCDSLTASSAYQHVQQRAPSAWAPRRCGRCGVAVSSRRRLNLANVRVLLRLIGLVST
jgi:uncharacterized paraquat-inducible protein A